RLLKERGHGTKQTWMERVVGGFEKRVLRVYGNSLTWFLRHRWISALTWILCLGATIWFFMAVPKTFLPVGGSGGVFGVIIGQEGSSPQQMRALQDQGDEIVHSNPYVTRAFSMTGNSQLLSSNQGLFFIFLRNDRKRPPVTLVAGQLMGGLATIPGV